MTPKEPTRKTPSDQRPTGGRQEPEQKKPREVGGPSGPDPTRYGDWERRGRCIDF
ncbi:MAG: DUF1674 domain-containing protein [Gammaproteobacteria bacterium]